MMRRGETQDDAVAIKVRISRGATSKCPALTIGPEEILT